VYPTPVIGMLGVVESLAHVTPATFQNDGDTILLLGSTRGHVGASEYLAAVHGLVAGDAPALNLAAEQALHQVLLEAIRAGFVVSAHDCSEGGLAVALAECCILQGDKLRGATVFTGTTLRADFRLFGEDQGRVIVSTRPDQAERVMQIADAKNVPATRIGIVGGPSLKIDGVLELDSQQAREVYQTAIERAMEQEL